MNEFTARMSAIDYSANSRSIHPNGRKHTKPYPGPGEGKHRRKALANRNARRIAHGQRESDAKDKAKTRAATDKIPGSMKR